MVLIGPDSKLHGALKLSNPNLQIFLDNFILESNQMVYEYWEI